MISSIEHLLESPIYTIVTQDMVLNDRESYKQFYDQFDKKIWQINYNLKYFDTSDDYVLLCYLWDKEKQCLDYEKPIYITQNNLCELIMKTCPYSFTIIKHNNRGISVNAVFIK